MVDYLFVGAAGGGFVELLLWATVGCHTANAPASASLILYLHLFVPVVNAMQGCEIEKSATISKVSVECREM